MRPRRQRVGCLQLSTLDSHDDGIDLAVVEGENHVEDVLIGEGGVVMRQMVYQQRDEVTSCSEGSRPRECPRRPRTIDLSRSSTWRGARASKGMRLSGGKGGSAAVGRAVG